MVLTLQYLTYVVLTCSLKPFILLMSHQLQVSDSRLLIWYRHMYYGTSHFDTSVKQFQWQQHFLTALTDIFQKTWFGIFNSYTTQIEINCSCSMATHLPPCQSTTERAPRYSHIQKLALFVSTQAYGESRIICVHGLAIASFPGLPHFYLLFAFAIVHGTNEKQGRPGSIYHVWTRGGYRGRRANIQICN